MHDHDDGGLDFYSTLYPALLAQTYTDGAGGAVAFRATGAIYGLDGNGVELHNGANPGKYTWANMLTMIGKGFDFANHSYLHTDVLPVQQVGQMSALAKTRFSALGSPYELKVGIVPTNYAGYPPAFYDAGLKLVSSQGTGGGYPLLPPYTEQATFLLSDIPATGRVVLRRSLVDPLSNTLAAEEALIDTLLTGTPAAPRVWRTFAHGVTSGLLPDLFAYANSRAADRLWVPSLREFADYLETKKSTTFTTSVSGSVVTLTLNQSAVGADVRYRDLSLLVSGAVMTSASQAGGQGVRMSADGTLLNFYNSDVALPLLAAATPTPTPTPAPAPTPTPAPTPAPAPAPAPAPTATATTFARITGQLPYTSSRAYQVSSLNNNTLRAFSTLTNTASPIPDYLTWVDGSNSFNFSFPAEQAVFLTEYVVGKPQYATAASANNTPFQIYYFDVAQNKEVLLGTFGDNVQTVERRYAVPNGGAFAKYVCWRVTGSKATFPNWHKFMATYLDAPAPALVRMPNPGLGLGIVDYWYNEQNPAALPSQTVDETRYANTTVFDSSRKYIPVTDIQLAVDRRETSAGVYVTDPRTLRVTAAYAGGYNLDALLTRAKTDGRYLMPNFMGNFMEYLTSYSAAPTATQQNAHNALTAYGADKNDPNSYLEWVKIAGQVTGRWGKVAVDPALLNFSTTKVEYYHPDGFNQKLTAMDIMHASTWGNESDKSYQGADIHYGPDAQAVFYSAVADADQGRMSVAGELRGVKSTDPSQLVGMGPTDHVDAGFIRAMDAKWRTMRGLRPDGFVDWPIDFITFNEYDRQDGTRYATPYSLASTRPGYEELVRTVRELQPRINVIYNTEFGFSVPPAVNTIDRSLVVATASRTASQRAADLTLNHVILTNRIGIKGFFYQLENDPKANPNLWDQWNGLTPETRAALLQLRGVVGTRGFLETVSNASYDRTLPYVDRYGATGVPSMYVLLMGDEVDRVGSFPAPAAGTVYRHLDTGTTMSAETVTVGQAITVRETACYLVLNA